jgi:Tsi6
MHQKHQTLKTALASCEAHLCTMPDFQPLHSVKAQLTYLIDLADGRSTDRSRLEEIIIGAYAAREFETRDMGFANLLYEVEEIVRAMKLGSI